MDPRAGCPRLRRAEAPMPARTADGGARRQRRRGSGGRLRRGAGAEVAPGFGEAVPELHLDEDVASRWGDRRRRRPTRTLGAALLR
uniref:Uncharacterized protein n=1 Tax=Arundo donax TaxID=35708 RepID=A0A0A9DHY4_ARUDO